MKPIVLLGEAFGANEAKIGRGFVGPSGIELLKLLAESSVIEWTAEDASFLSRFYNTSDPVLIDAIWGLHPEVHRANVFALHPPGNDITTLCGTKTDAIPGYPILVKSSKYVRKEFANELNRLGDELLEIDPNLIVALGNTPLWALCGLTGVSKVRGTTRLSTHTVSGFKVLPTYHPAAILRQWELRPTTLADLTKAKHEATHPNIQRPQREIWIEPTHDDIAAFIAKYITPGGLIAVDIETAGNRITCIGFAAGPGVALVIPFDDDRRTGRHYWPTLAAESKAWALVRGVLEDHRVRKIFQNGLYDIAFLLRSMGIKVLGAEHDTMLLHHALQPESLKGLGYLGSIYTDEGAWKRERPKTQTIKRDE